MCEGIIGKIIMFIKMTIIIFIEIIEADNCI